MKKSSSTVIDTAATRAAGVDSIDPKLDLGTGLTQPAYKMALFETQARLAAYNTILSQADEASNLFEAAERSLNDLNERMLASVAARFGRDSHEYEMAGGKRKSERKRPVRKIPAQIAA